MKMKKGRKNKDRKLNDVICPNCNFKIDVNEIGLVMFESCTVFSCPVCKKTIAIYPKGKEFEIKQMEEDE